MMNIGLPSIFVKMLRQKFDQQWSLRKSEMTEDEQRRVLRLIKPVRLNMDARLQGPTLTVQDMMGLRVGDILAFDYPIEAPVDLLVNGKPKHKGYIQTNGRRVALRVDQIHETAG